MSETRKFSALDQALLDATGPATPDAGARETEIARVISSEIGDAIAAHEAGEGEAAVSKRGETVARWIMDRIHPTPPSAALPITDHAVHSQALWEEFFDKANGVLDGDKLLREVAALRATPPRAASPEPGAFTPQMAYEVWRASERDEAEGETRWHMLAAEINLRLQNMNPPAPSGATDREPIDALRDALYHAHVAGQRVHDLRVDTVTALAYASGAVEYMNLGSELPAHPPAAASPEPGAYAITLQRMIEAHCRGERVNETLSPHIGAMLNANLAAPRADATAGGVTVTDAMVEAVYGVLSDDVCDIVNRVDVEEWLDAALRAAQPDGGAK